MNLGDGLLFELDNGKPKLILLSRGVEKNAAKLICRPRAANILSIKQPTCVDEVQVKERPARQWAGSHREIKTGVAVSITSNTTNGRRSTTLTSTKSHDHIKGETGKIVAKVKSDKHSSAIGSLKASEKTGLPQKSGTGGKIGLQENVAGRDADAKDSVNSLTSEQLQKILSSVESTASGQDPPADLKTEGIKTESKCDSSMNEGEGGGADMTVTSQDEDTSVSGGLFSWLEERHSESRAAIDHRKAQWKRELDEQVAIKQQKQLSAPGRLQADKAVSVLSVRSSIRHKEQPAALRSSLMLGEVTPMEEVLSVKRKEEQRRHWLEELDKQREETTERRRREKLLQSQSEDHDLWASHFDSLKKRPHFQRVAPLPGPLISSEEEPLSRLSLISEAMSTVRPESVQGASVDTTSGYQTRTSYLRNMTALLDPTQLEERERRRIRRLEQQQAIEAQVKERQQQREQEEARKRQEEEEEERRLAVEREILERRYKLDTMKERQKKHPSPQVEQPNKGYGKETHQKTLEIKTIIREDKCLEEVSRLTSTYKDTAVQTEAVPSVPRTDDGVHTAHISTQCQPHLLSAAAPNRKNQIVKRGKENICAPGGGERRGGDPYEAFARTDRSKKDRTKPDWNTQRPGRQFVPASERYPASQQKNRQESRMKRQAELLALQGRTCLSRTNLPPPRHHHLEPHLSPDLTQTRTSPSRKLESVSRGHSSSANIHVERGHSPAIPTVIHRIQNLRDPPSTSRPPPPPAPPAPGQEFVPYIRTWEVFNLDPLESADTPPPRIHNEAPPAPSHPDRMLHPELICNTHRQQETLRGLAQLRQGLLQKQRELAMDPLLKRYETKPC